MRVVIDIPKDFEAHFNADRFRDSLIRLSADADNVAGLYEIELALMLARAFGNAEIIKDKSFSDSKVKHCYATKAHDVELAYGYNAYEEMSEGT